MTNKRITLQAGDYIKLSDIPNEQVFNLVENCFASAGFTNSSVWEDRDTWQVLQAYMQGASCFAGRQHQANKRQLSLSDVFNSVNGNFNWYGLNHVTITKYDVSCWPAQVVIDQGDSSAYTIKRISDSPEAIIQPKVSQWWDYDKGCAVGLPPVDTWCQYSLSSGRTWFKCKVISHDKLVLDCPHVEDENGNGLQIVNKNAVMFRPLDYKTPKQITVDKALDLAAQNMSFEVYTERLYDAGLLKAI